VARYLIPSDLTIRAVKPGDARKRLNDGDGLYLLLFVKGGAHGWRFAYSLHGRRNNLSLGTYPDTGLSLARKKADEARRLVSEGIDPSETRQAAKQQAKEKRDAHKREEAGLPAAAFQFVAKAWFATRSNDWAPSYANKIMARLETLVLPHIGRRPVGEITPPELLALLRSIEARGTVETAHRVRETCSQVFRFALAEGRISSDPARDLVGALRSHQTKHIASLTDPAEFGALLRAIDGYKGTATVRAALQLAALVFVRPGGELRMAAWAEFDLDGAVWRVPAARMKRRKVGKEDGPPHLVPLSRQAVAVLRELYPLTGESGLVFRGERQKDKPISENTLNAALDTLGFTASQMRAHGFRAAARTMLHERLNVAPEVIEAQLAHAVPDALGRAYNRTEFLEQRRTMMQTWADYLDKLRKGGEVVPLHAGAGGRLASGA